MHHCATKCSSAPKNAPMRRKMHQCATKCIDARQNVPRQNAAMRRKMHRRATKCTTAVPQNAAMRRKMYKYAKKCTDVQQNASTCSKMLQCAMPTKCSNVQQNASTSPKDGVYRSENPSLCAPLLNPKSNQKCPLKNSLPTAILQLIFYNYFVLQLFCTIPSPLKSKVKTEMSAEKPP